VTRPVVLRGTIAGPAVAIDGSERLGLELTTTIDRHDFGVSWNAPLPKGGFAVGDQVRLSAHIELVRER
jgi:polyisoprenoid-binding protein YceI